MFTYVDEVLQLRYNDGVLERGFTIGATELDGVDGSIGRLYLISGNNNHKPAPFSHFPLLFWDTKSNTNERHRLICF